MTFGRNIQQSPEYSLYVSSCRFGFINFSSFKPNTENNANCDAVSSKLAKFDEVQFLNNIPKPIIFGTHNMQSFKYNTLINALLLMQF